MKRLPPKVRVERGAPLSKGGSQRFFRLQGPKKKNLTLEKSSGKLEKLITDILGKSPSVYLCFASVLRVLKWKKLTPMVIGLKKFRKLRSSDY